MSLGFTQIIGTFLLVYLAMIAMGHWEAYVEGRNAWDKGKLGWRFSVGKFTFTAYHFYLSCVTLPALLSLPLWLLGWQTELFGVLLSAYLSGLVLEDLTWYLVNPAVSFKEWFSPFSDYYPWVKLKGRKIIPVPYLLGGGLALLSWYFLWS